MRDGVSLEDYIRQVLEYEMQEIYKNSISIDWDQFTRELLTEEKNKDYKNLLKK